MPSPDKSRGLEPKINFACGHCRQGSSHAFHCTFFPHLERSNRKKMKIDSPPDPLFLPPCSRALAPASPARIPSRSARRLVRSSFKKITPAGASIARLRALAALRTRRLAGRLRRPFGLRPEGSARTATSLRLQPELEENASRLSTRLFLFSRWRRP